MTMIHPSSCSSSTGLLSSRSGLFLLHTGDGKGKTSAAMNLVYRHLAHDLPVAVIQFLKSPEGHPDGDRLFLGKLSSMGLPVEVRTLGTGCSWNRPDEDAARQAAADAWEFALRLLQAGKHRLVVLDELHIAIFQGMLDPDDVLAGIQSRHPETHVVTIGRYAPMSMMEEADLVTEMKLIRHPHERHVPAQMGIEY